MRQTVHRTVLTDRRSPLPQAIGRWPLVRLVSCLSLYAAVWCATSAASASEKARIKSRFTTVELKSCESAKAEHGGVWTCKGLGGYPVHVAEDDLRQFVSFGPNGKSRRAATQTLKPFNSIFAAGHSRATIEWRFRRADGRDVPYATIVRFHTSRGAAVMGGREDGRGDGGKGEGRGEVLVVTKVTLTEACQIARIDARANPEAIVLARSAADELTKDFDCQRDQPRILGATGRSPM
jgi:hypothetical protein